MSAQVALIRRPDRQASADDSLSLYNFEEGYSLTRDGWVPAETRAGADPYTPISDAMTLMVKGDTFDDLAAAVQGLHQKMREMAQYLDDGADVNLVWLRDELPNEGTARDVMVTALAGAPGRSLHGPTVSPGYFLQEYTLSMERMPFFEEPEISTYPSSGQTAVSTLGGALSMGDGLIEVRGDVSARVAEMRLMGVSGGGGPYYEAWVGFRSDRYGTPAQFQPVLELEDGTMGTDAAADELEPNDTSPGSGSGGRVLIDFATETGMDARVTLALADATGVTSSVSQRGRFTVLLRAKVAASTTCHVRLMTGYQGTGADDFVAHDRVSVTVNDWYLYPLGTVQIPLTARRGSAYIDASTFRIDAERISGSGNLFLDCLVLIPEGEGSLHVSDAAILYDGNYTNEAAYIYKGPEGNADGWQYDAGEPQKALAINPAHYELPVGDDVHIVVAAQRETQHVFADTMTVSLQFYERWRSLREYEYRPVS